jgi:hypothetical protein
MEKNLNSLASTAMLMRLQIVEESEVKDILERDASNLGIKNIKRFVSMNLTQAYLMLNVWLLMIQQLVDVASLSNFVAFVKTYGIFRSIEYCAQIADDLLGVAADIVSLDYAISEPVGVLLTFQGLRIDTVLQLLRYPKRFTWVSADELADKSLRKMHEINSLIKRRASKSDRGVEPQFAPFIIDRMRDYYASALKGFTNFYVDELPNFSSGVCQYAKTLPEKLNFVSYKTPYWVVPGIPLKHTAKCDAARYMNFFVDAVAVPKSYKAYRIITPLSPWRASELQRVRAAWEKSLAANGFTQYFNVEDQDRNRELAMMGSADGSYTTVDMSSASDSISRELAYSLLPAEVVDVISPWMERFISYRLSSGRELDQACYMFGTSGNPITFVHEGTFFMSACLTANDIFNLYFRMEDEEEALPPSIFGDDMVVDTRVFELLSDILRNLRCYINPEKTFSDGHYRESCGEEYFSGLDIASKFWPRKGFKSSQFKPESQDFAMTVSSLCSMQHRLWGYPTSRTFLENYIRTLVPDMTSSPVGSESTDLWAMVPQFAKRSAPHRGELPSDISVALREAHYGTVSEETDTRDSNVESYLYVQYLKYGPKLSEDPLCKLLGLTEQRTFSSKPRVRLKKIIK